MIRTPKPKVPTLKQIAARIQEHLRRLSLTRIPERDGTFLTVSATKVGMRVYIRYVNEPRSFGLTKTEALQYLAYLDGGGTGTHLLRKKESDDA